MRSYPPEYDEIECPLCESTDKRKNDLGGYDCLNCERLDEIEAQLEEWEHFTEEEKEAFRVMV